VHIIQGGLAVSRSTRRLWRPWAATTIASLFVCCGASTAGASAPGAETVDRSGTLQTSGQSMWQAGSGGGPQEKTITMFDKSWSASGSGGSISDVHSPTVTVCNIFKGKTVEKFFTEGSTSCEDEEEISIDVGDCQSRDCLL
jgi:hypothetical protein